MVAFAAARPTCASCVASRRAAGRVSAVGRRFPPCDGTFWDLNSDFGDGGRGTSWGSLRAPRTTRRLGAPAA